VPEHLYTSRFSSLQHIMSLPYSESDLDSIGITPLRHR
jgi:hypothetical protein